MPAELGGFASFGCDAQGQAVEQSFGCKFACAQTKIAFSRIYIIIVRMCRLA